MWCIFFLDYNGFLPDLLSSFYINAWRLFNSAPIRRIQPRQISGIAVNHRWLFNSAIISHIHQNKAHSECSLFLSASRVDSIFLFLTLPSVHGTAVYMFLWHAILFFCFLPIRYYLMSLAYLFHATCICTILSDSDSQNDFCTFLLHPPCNKTYPNPNPIFKFSICRS